MSERGHSGNEWFWRIENYTMNGRVFVIAVLVLGLVVGLPAVYAQPCNPPPPVENFWTGAFDGTLWSQGGNWSENAFPEECHNVHFDIVANSVMDIPSSFATPHDILSFSVSTSGALTMGDASGGSSTGLNVFNDLISTATINTHLVKVGELDGLYVGNPCPVLDGNGECPDAVDSDTGPLAWEITGGSNTAFVAVTGTIGRGQWTIDAGTLSVGHTRGPQVFVPIPGMTGTINSGVLPGGPGASTWTIEDDSTVFAKRGEDLDWWFVTSGAEGGGGNQADQTVITIRDYLEVNTMLITGHAWNIRCFDTLIVEGSGAVGEEGLEVLGLLRLTNDGLGGPDAQRGPCAIADYTEVAEGADVQLSGGSLFEAGTNQGLTGPLFRDGSGLIYGPVHPTPYETEFRVTAVAARTTVFEDESIIGTKEDPNLDEMDLLMVLETSLDVQGRLNLWPARDWYTGGVDLEMGPTGGLELEVFAADVCNIWLDDVPEPRCLKYWQSFRANSNGNPLKLVNNRKKNYPNGGNPEAMYVSEDVNHNNNLDLNGLRMYYGGSLTGDPMTGLIPMIHTAYGDFNGDCVIDNGDRAVFSDAFTAPGITTRNPNVDWDGDCDVDLAEAVEFSARFGTMPPALCESGTQPACNCPSFFDVCPVSPGGGGGGPEGMSALMGVAFVDFVSMEVVEDESDWPEFVGVIEAATDWCLVHMTPGQRQGICNAISNPALPLAMPEVAALIPGIIATLSE